MEVVSTVGGIVQSGIIYIATWLVMGGILPVIGICLYIHNNKNSPQHMEAFYSMLKAVGFMLVYSTVCIGGIYKLDKMGYLHKLVTQASL